MRLSSGKRLNLNRMTRESPLCVCGLGGAGGEKDRDWFKIETQSMS